MSIYVDACLQEMQLDSELVSILCHRSRRRLRDLQYTCKACSVQLTSSSCQPGSVSDDAAAEGC